MCPLYGLTIYCYISPPSAGNFFFCPFLAKKSEGRCPLGGSDVDCMGVVMLTVVEVDFVVDADFVKVILNY